MDARVATLVETIAAVQVALDQIADRVEELEPVVDPPTRAAKELLPPEEPVPPRPDAAATSDLGTPDLSTPDLRDW